MPRRVARGYSHAARLSTHRDLYPPRFRAELVIGASQRQPEPSGPRTAPGQTLALFVSTAAGVGYAPVAPGTFGSAAALPVFVLLSHLDFLLYSLTVVALAFLGVWASERAEAIFER